VLLAQLRDQVCDFRRIFLEIGHDNGIVPPGPVNTK
jgi:hypothetical protein